MSRLYLDAYYTPDRLAQALVELLPIEPAAVVLEPHVGGGAFAHAIAGRLTTGALHALDLDPAAPGLASDAPWNTARGDFLAVREGDLCQPDWIVGNPPYTDVERHLDHALRLTRRHVAFLLRLGVLESAKRLRYWRRWPLRRLWVLSQRPSFTGGGTDSRAYGWFWFDRLAGKLEPTLGWLGTWR